MIDAVKRRARTRTGIATPMATFVCVGKFEEDGGDDDDIGLMIV